MKFVPKNYRCSNCGREQYTNDHCYGCGNNEFTKLNNERETNQMEIKYSLYAKSFDDKEKLVSALTNSGYIVGAELEKDKVISTRTNGWRVDIYNRRLEENSII